MRPGLLHHRGITPVMAEAIAVLTEAQIRKVVRAELEEVLADYAGRAPALLDRQQLAQALSVSVPTVDRLRRKGLPTVWVVDAPRFELRAVLEWLAQLKHPRL